MLGWALRSFQNAVGNMEFGRLVGKDVAYRMERYYLGRIGGDRLGGQALSIWETFDTTTERKRTLKGFWDNTRSVQATIVLERGVPLDSLEDPA